MHTAYLPARLAGRYPKIILVFSFLLTLLLLAGIPKLKMRPFFEGDLPAHDPIIRANEHYTAYFGSDEKAYLALVSDNIYNPSTLAKITAITEELNQLDDVLTEQTLSLATARKVKWREWGLDIRKYLTPLPTTPEEIERLRQDVRLDKDIHGRLVSNDEKAALFAIKLDPGYDHRKLHSSLYSIAQKYSGPEHIYPFGHQIMNEEANQGMRHDLMVLGPAALLSMGIGIFIFFRSVRVTLGPVLVIIMSIIWTFGLMRWLGLPISVLSSSMPPMLIAIGSSYAIHVLYGCKEASSGMTPKERVAEGVARTTSPILLAALNSMVGFATLVTFKVLSIREFGPCVALGVALAAVFSLIVLPAILTLQKSFLEDSRRSRIWSFDAVLADFADALTRHKYLVVGIVLLLLVVSAAGIMRLKVGVVPEEIFPPGHRARHTISVFTRYFQGPYNLNVMITAERPDGLKSPEALKEIEKFQKFAEELPRVKYAASIVDIIKRMNRILNEDDPAYDTLPDSEEMIAQLLLLHSITQEPVQFSSLIDYDFQRCKVSISTTTIDSIQLEDIYYRLRQYADENMGAGLKADFGGRSMVWIAQNHYIIRGKIINIITSTFVIWAICALAFRSIGVGLISIVPLSFATIMTFGVMGWFGIRLDMTTAVLTGISVGIGLDFAIYFIARLKRAMLNADRIDEALRAAMGTAGMAIVFDATVNMLGFSVVMLSGFTPARRLGFLICFNMLVCLALTLIIIPVIFALVPFPLAHMRKEALLLQNEERPAPASVE